MTYSDSLKDPRWQKKRLLILQRDCFTCVCCGSQDKTLHIHHHYYIAGRLPWEYSDELLVTLCADCHKCEEDLKEIDNDFVKVLLSSGLLRTDLERIVNFIIVRGGSAKPGYFRRLFNRLLDRVEFSLRPKPIKRNMNLLDLLK